MAIFNFQIVLYSLSMFFFCILFLQTTSLTFNLTNSDLIDLLFAYDQNNITLFGDSYLSTQGLLVTGDIRNTTLMQQVGKVTYTESLHLWDNSTGNLTDFSTHFVFVIDSNGQQSYPDGLTLFLAPDGSDFTAGGAMGLPIDPVTEAPTSPFVAVEFDTNADVWDLVYLGSATHVDIDVNYLTSNVTAVWYSNIAHGIENGAWIRYYSSTYNMSVVFTDYNGYSSRVEGSIDFIVDLRNYLSEWVTIGFSASTGQDFQENTVKSWEFSSSLEINETNKTVIETNTTVTVNKGNKNVTDPVIIPGSKKILPWSCGGTGCRLGCFSWWVCFGWIWLLEEK